MENLDSSNSSPVSNNNNTNPGNNNPQHLENLIEEVVAINNTNNNEDETETTTEENVDELLQQLQQQPTAAGGAPTGAGGGAGNTNSGFSNVFIVGHVENSTIVDANFFNNLTVNDPNNLATTPSPQAENQVVNNTVQPTPDNGGPTATNDVNNVSESLLATGSLAGMGDAIVTGNLLENDDLGIDGAFIDNINGIVAVNGIITITTDIGELTVFTTEAAAAANNAIVGDYSYQLLTNTNANEQAEEIFTYTLIDNGNPNNTATADLTINIEDDAPITEVDNSELFSTASSALNITFIFDLSAAMAQELSDDEDDCCGFTFTRLELLQNIIYEIGFTQAFSDSYYPTKINLIGFSSASEEDNGIYQASVLLNPFEDDPIDILDEFFYEYLEDIEVGVTLDGVGSEFDLGLNAAQELLEEDLAEENFNNYTVYFIAGGAPDEGHMAPPQWQSFVDSNGVNVVPIALFPEEDGIELGFEGVGNFGDEVLVLDSFYDFLFLEELFYSSMYQANASGNVVDNDILGADGFYQVSAISFELESAEAAEFYAIDYEGPSTFTIDGSTITFEIPADGAVRFTMLDGSLDILFTANGDYSVVFNFLDYFYEYEYEYEYEEGEDEDELSEIIEASLSYTIVDGDGSEVQGLLNIEADIEDLICFDEDDFYDDFEQDLMFQSAPLNRQSLQMTEVINNEFSNEPGSNEGGAQFFAMPPQHHVVNDLTFMDVI